MVKPFNFKLPDGSEVKVWATVKTVQTTGGIKVMVGRTELFTDTVRVVADWLEERGFRYQPGSFGTWRRTQ